MWERAKEIPALLGFTNSMRGIIALSHVKAEYIAICYRYTAKYKWNKLL